MTTAPWIKIPAGTAAVICARFQLRLAAQALLGPDMTPQQFLAALMEKREYGSAIEFMAHALPPREAVWWGCLTVQDAFGDSLAGLDRDACRASVNWVMKPSEESRLKAHSLIGSSRTATAPGALVVAVGMHGIIPAIVSTGGAVANAVTLASFHGGAGDLAPVQQRYIGLALGIAAGRFM